MSDQQVIDQRHEEARLVRVRVEACEVCSTEYEYQRDTAKWYSVHKMEYCTAVWVGRAFLCSDRCKSQHLYNIGTQQDRDLMCALARFCEQWERSGIDPLSHDWCMRHLHTGIVVDRSDLSLIQDAITSIKQGLAGEDAVNGKDDPPGWYCNAVKDIWDAPAPETQPMRLVPRIVPQTANALTAAAPEMLDALIRFTLYSDGELLRDDVAAARAAIAKATGGAA